MRGVHVRNTIVAATTSLAVGCAPSKPPVAAASVTVVVRGDDATAVAVKDAIRKDTTIPVELRVAEPPTAPGTDTTKSDSDAAEKSLAEAKKAYVDGSFAACMRLVDGDDTSTALLVDKKVALAARFAFWRVACRVGAGLGAEAEKEAARFAVSGYELPSDVGIASPDVETMLVRARQTVTAAASVTAEFVHPPFRGDVFVDGVRACTTPCSVDLRPGGHVFVFEAEGFAPEVRSVRVDKSAVGANAIRFAPALASPELASAQWARLYARSPLADGTASMRLLSRAVRAPRLAFVDVDGGEASRLRGALAESGAVTARGERTGTSARAGAELTVPLLRDLLVQGKVTEPAPKLWASPWFWATVTVVAAGVATGTYFLLRPPEQRTEVRF
ncbi:MAG: PEGA domain-containing protein [Polyangiaceae bacterium]